MYQEISVYMHLQSTDVLQVTLRPKEKERKRTKRKDKKEKKEKKKKKRKEKKRWEMK